MNDCSRKTRDAGAWVSLQINGWLDEAKADRDRLKAMLEKARNEIMDKVPLEIRDAALYDAINDALGQLAKK